MKFKYKPTTLPNVFFVKVFWWRDFAINKKIFTKRCILRKFFFFLKVRLDVSFNRYLNVEAYLLTKSANFESTVTSSDSLRFLIQNRIKNVVIFDSYLYIIYTWFKNILFQILIYFHSNVKINFLIKFSIVFQ